MYIIYPLQPLLRLFFFFLYQFVSFSCSVGEEIHLMCVCWGHNHPPPPSKPDVQTGKALLLIIKHSSGESQTKHVLRPATLEEELAQCHLAHCISDGLLIVSTIKPVSSHSVSTASLPNYIVPYGLAAGGNTQNRFWCLNSTVWAALEQRGLFVKR